MLKYLALLLAAVLASDTVLAGACPSGVWDTATTQSTLTTQDSTTVANALNSAGCARILTDGTLVTGAVGVASIVNLFPATGEASNQTYNLANSSSVAQTSTQCVIDTVGNVFYYGSGQAWKIPTAGTSLPDAEYLGALTEANGDAPDASTFHQAAASGAVAVSGTKNHLYVNNNGTWTTWAAPSEFNTDDNTRTLMGLWENRVAAMQMRTNENAPYFRMSREGYAPVTSLTDPGASAWKQQATDNEGRNNLGFVPSVPCASSANVGLYGPTPSAETYSSMTWRQDDLKVWGARNCTFGSTQGTKMQRGIGPLVVSSAAAPETAAAATGTVVTQNAYNLAETQVPAGAAGRHLTTGALLAGMAALIL